MPHNGVVRDDDDFTIGVILVHGKARDYVHLLAYFNTCDRITHRIDDAGGFVSQPSWKFHRFDVLILAPHRLGSVDADGLDLDSNLVCAGFRDLRLDELQYFWRPGSRELD